MSTFTIGESPQALFPEGLQEDFVVTNTGLSSIYLGNDSSVAVATGYRIPPLGTIVWSGHKPLWAVCGNLPSYQQTNPARTVDIPGRLSTTRNTAPLALGPSTHDVSLLYEMGNSGATDDMKFFRIETGSVKTLMLTFRMDAVLTTAHERITFTVNWGRSGTTNTFYIEEFELWYPDTTSKDIHVEIPVKGAQCDITVTPTTTARTFTRVLFFAKTQESKYRGNSFELSPFYCAQAATERSSDSFFRANWNMTDPIYVQPMSPVIDFALRASGGVTVAGKIVLLSQGGGWFADIPIAVGAANQVYEKSSLIIPQGVAMRLVGAPAPSGAGDFDVSVISRGGMNPTHN